MTSHSTGNLLSDSTFASTETQTLSITGNSYVDSILWGGAHYDNVITYSFWDDASLDDAFDAIDVSNTPWSTHAVDAMQQALQTWANVADIEFVQATTNDPNAQLGFMLVNETEFDALGMFNPPGEFGAGIGYFGYQGTGWNLDGLQPGGYGFVTLIHELGHGLGLAHPHDNGGGSSVFPGVESSFDDYGDNDLNQGIWTTMSYNDGWVTQNGHLLFDQDIVEYGYQGTPMAFDIAAIQHLYGANLDYNTGHDTYFLPTANGSGTSYSCIWDAGGIDTISAETATTSAFINLSDAPLTGPNAGGYVSFVNQVYGGFTIANGAVIENAVGGAGNDQIIGNDVGNSLYGGAGHDHIDGGEGQDLLQGEQGDDILVGGYGDDEVSGGEGNDVLIGANPLFWGAGFDEYDVLSGGQGADVFVLGDEFEAYYQGSGYAFITDFNWFEGDVIEVFGAESDYSFSFGNWYGDSWLEDTEIYYQDSLVGIVQDATEIEFSWVSDSWQTWGFFSVDQSNQFQAIGGGNGVSVSDVTVNGIQLAQLFDEGFYLAENQDVANAVESGDVLSGFEHFAQHGVAEGRDPSILYNEGFYLAHNSDVADAIAAGIVSSGLEHFLNFGHAEGRDPSSLFRQSDYLTNNPDVLAAVNNGLIQSAFEHFVESGINENRVPSMSLYDEAFYLGNNSDVTAAVTNGSLESGFDHYVQFGQIEGRDPSAMFDESAYLANNADIAAAVTSGSIRSGFGHYVQFGRFEGREAIALIA